MDYFDYLPTDVIITILIKVDYATLRPYDLNIIEFPEKDTFQGVLDSPYFWYLKLYHDYPTFDIHNRIITPEKEMLIKKLGDVSYLKDIPESLYAVKYSELTPYGYKLIYYIYDAYVHAMMCKSCGSSDKYKLLVRNTRSSDEGTMSYFLCMNCKHTSTYTYY